MSEEKKSPEEEVPAWAKMLLEKIDQLTSQQPEEPEEKEENKTK